MTTEKKNKKIAYFIGLQLYDKPIGGLGHNKKYWFYPSDIILQNDWIEYCKTGKESELLKLNRRREIWDYRICEEFELKYHSDWNCLMPVIEKICRMQFEDGDYIYPRTFGMTNPDSKKFMFRFNRFQCFEGDTLIEAAYNAVVDYLHYIKI